MTGKRVCHLHGGKTPRGTASPHYIHGRYSRELPARLLDRFEASVADPSLLELTREIALVDALTADAVSRLDGDEEGVARAELGELVDRRARLASVEARRIQMGRESLSASEAMALVAALVQAVRESVHDPLVLAEIDAKFARIVNTGNPAALTTEPDAIAD